MVLWQLPSKSAERTHGMKYRLYNGLVDGTGVVRYDDEHIIVCGELRDRRLVQTFTLEHYLVDTCRVWRREGPLVEKIAAAAGIRVEGKNGEL